MLVHPIRLGKNDWKIPVSSHKVDALVNKRIKNNTRSTLKLLELFLYLN